MAAGQDDVYTTAERSGGKPQKLSDRDIVVKVLELTRTSVGWYDSRLSVERQRVLAYYNGELPKRQTVGASSYISPEVYDSVEMMKAQLLEVFGGGDQIAKFDPDQAMNAEACRVATEYASYIIFRQNCGFKVFEDVIHDALMARIGVAQVYWEECYEDRDEEFDGLQEHEVMGLAAQDDVTDLDADVDDDSGLYSGKMTRKVDKSQVRIEVVPPEEFLLYPRWPNFKTIPYCGRRTLKTKAELIAMGYDEDVVMPLHYDDSKGLDLSPEVIERNKPIESSQPWQNFVQPEMELVMVYESYVRLQIDPKKGVKLYKVVHVNEVVLDKQEVDKPPFVIYTPLPIPHMIYGNNYAARVIPYQNAQTVLNRAVLDHTSITVNPRWAVVKGGLINPREMLENRLGGIVNVRTPESVSPMQYPNLNPFVFEVMQNLQQNKEQTTGISSLSQGLNQDAISQQNSGALVDNLVQLSGIRQKICARNFAYGFFTELMCEVIRLAILHEKKQKFIEVAGDVLQIDPTQWCERTTCSVSLHLGYGEKDQQVQKMQQAYQGMAGDPGLAPGFGYPQRYAMIQDIAKKQGQTNFPQYLQPPNQVKPPPPDPVKMAEIQAKGKTADAALLNAQANMQGGQAQAASDGVKHRLEFEKIRMQAHVHGLDQSRKDAEAVARIKASNHQQRMDSHQDARDTLSAIHDAHMSHRQQSMDEINQGQQHGMAIRDHGLQMQQHAHQQSMDQQQQALSQQQAEHDAVMGVADKAQAQANNERDFQSSREDADRSHQLAMKAAVAKKATAKR